MWFRLISYQDIVVIMAHIDTVFPDLQPMPMREEAGRLYCPGVGDDTANVAGMLTLMDIFHRLNARPACGVLFVCNSCEEGLGNLAGCKAIMRDFAPRVKAFLSLDDQSTHVCARAVGSARYRITAETRGGHSFADFGARNAVEVLSRLVCALYRQHVPRAAGSLTTYNVGVISGGTSVNAIAQRAEMLYEYRSNDAQCMAMMKEKLDTILRESTMPDAKVTLKLLVNGPADAAGDPAARACWKQGAQPRWNAMLAAKSPSAWDRRIAIFHSHWGFLRQALACIAEGARIRGKNGWSPLRCARA